MRDTIANCISQNRSQSLLGDHSTEVNPNSVIPNSHYMDITNLDAKSTNPHIKSLLGQPRTIDVETLVSELTL